MKHFKIRASSCGDIMSGNIGASDSQLENIKKMEARETPMTAIQKEKYDKAIFARDFPELPAGARTFCQTWLRENLVYNRRKEFRSKYTDKGNFCESQSIVFLNKQLLEDWKKCEVSKENDFSTGTCDIEAPGLIVDIKNSYDTGTFPLFDFGIKNKDYFYQGQIYMELYDKEKFTLAYTLMDAPFHLIEREAWSQCYNTGIDYKSEEGAAVFHEVQRHMTFEDVEPKYKYKLFNIDRDPAVIVEVKKRVALCRIYIKGLIEGLEK